ncbi:hypothetical protein RCH09_000275 [Actimicrobium sp. GrIS 1.19]|uniref:hypothetical protein n=1 Tax=Actimicrobium sp. GrIS 1.19 TaxID=3071708 RepID=UPI002E051986|nr:hypothetical protein [Actimicrobium sp. GrIS 1.19]
MRADVMIEIVVVVDKASGHSKVVYLCDIAPAGDSMDLFVAEDSKSIALYHHLRYDDAGRDRRNRAAMTYPDGRGEKLILVGQVQRALQLDAATQIEVSRAHLRLKAIPVDEWD